MKKIAILLVLCITALYAAPVPVIFDTDMGNDVDDALALAMLHALQSKGECEILAVTTNKDNPYSPALCDVINTFYGRPEIPLGAVRNSGVTPRDDYYAPPVVESLDQDGRYTYARRCLVWRAVPDATQVLRKALAEAEDHSVVLIVVGFSTNLARLLESGPDEISPLSGKALLAQKGKLVSVMAGNFKDPKKPEYNVMKDVASARNFYRECPIPMVFSGYEVGAKILYPWAAIENDYQWAPHHPVVDAYRAYKQGKPYDRPTWDLCASLYAVRPQAGYFTLSGKGTVSPNGDKGQVVFAPTEDGKHQIMLEPTPQQIQAVLGAFRELCAQQP